jgi:hypothetical protein
MAENKTQRTTASVPAFLATIADPARRKETKGLVSLIREITGEKPVMWGPSIIGFGDMSYTASNGKAVSWFPIGLSPRKAALTLYLMGGLKPHAALLKKLGPHKIGGGCLYLPKPAALDEQVLRQLIKANQVLTRASSRQRKG